MLRKRMRAALLCLCMAAGMLPAMTAAAQAAEAYLWPVPAGRALSRGYSDGHHALDIISGGSGTDILATKSGTVVKVYTGCGNYNAAYRGVSCSTATCSYLGAVTNGWTSGGVNFCNYGCGNGVIVRHSDGSGYSMYGHMLAVRVSEGSSVRQGQILGTMGSTGNSSGQNGGTHLHFELGGDMRVSGNYYQLTSPINNNLESISYIDRVSAAFAQNIGEDFYAYIANTHSGHNLENRSNNVQLAAADKYDPRQIWHFTHLGWKQYKIANLYDGRCLDTDGTNVRVMPYTGMNNQYWQMCGTDSYSTNSTLYYIAPPAYGENDTNHTLVLDVAYGNEDHVPAGRNVQLIKNCYGGSDISFVEGGPFHKAQTFQILKISDIETVLTQYARGSLGSDFYARISYNGSYLEADGVTAESGRGMGIRTSAESRPADPKRIWHFRLESGGAYTITNEYNGWYLDVPDGDAHNKAIPRLWFEDSGSTLSGRRWQILYSPGDSAYRVVSSVLYPSSLFSLDIPAELTDANGIPTDGSNIQICEQNASDNQRFSIAGISYTPPARPAAPTNIRVTAASGGTMITWDDVPADGAYESRAYEVYLTGAGNEVLIPRTRVEGACYTSDVVLPDGEYRAAVRTVNTKYADLQSDAQYCGFTVALGSAARDAIVSGSADRSAGTVRAVLEARTAAVLAGAVYGQSGQMLDASMTAVPAGRGEAELRFRALPNTCTVRLMLLDGSTWKPLCGIYAVS